MRATRTLTSLAVLAALTALAGCGSDESPSTAPTDSTSLPTGEDPAVLDVCAAITAAEVGELVGGTVTLKEVPGGGCSFDQEDPRATSIAFSASAYDEANGGFDAAVSGASGVIEGTDDQEVPGVGTQALVSVGTTMGGENQQASGLVHVADSLVQITLLQGEGLSADAVRTIAVNALKLVASKA